MAPFCSTGCWISSKTRLRSRQYFSFFTTQSYNISKIVHTYKLLSTHDIHTCLNCTSTFIGNSKKAKFHSEETLISVPKLKLYEVQITTHHMGRRIDMLHTWASSGRYHRIGKVWLPVRWGSSRVGSREVRREVLSNSCRWTYQQLLHCNRIENCEPLVKWSFFNTFANKTNIMDGHEMTISHPKKGYVNANPIFKLVNPTAAVVLILGDHPWLFALYAPSRNDVWV